MNNPVSVLRSPEKLEEKGRPIDSKLRLRWHATRFVVESRIEKV
jgi:hypothetical protein